MGRRAQISRDAILRASLAIADNEGLDAVTMQAVAGRLDVTPMALYRHVASKADLLDALVESLLTGFALPSDELPWDRRLREIGRSMREIARKHPQVFPLLLRRPATTPASLRVRAAARQAIEDAGLDSERAGHAERLISTAILGFAASQAGGRFRELPAAAIDADYALLETVIDGALRHQAA
jgi:AcrR family transcriptional regulator